MSDDSISTQRVPLSACGLPFVVDPVAANMPQPKPMPARSPVAAELCEMPVRVTVAEAPPLSDLDLGDFGAYRYDATRATVWIRRPALSAVWESEALRGPVLLHALAQQSVFVLHASAARSPRGALVAFTAPSGIGKSTLAQVAAELGWQRVGDDLLPVTERAGQILALPHFPQPKLGDSQQYPVGAPPALRLAALIQLERGPALKLERLAPRKAADLLLASTVATRVFASRSLATHLAFAANLAAAAATGELLVARASMADQPNDIAGAVAQVLDAVASALEPAAHGSP